jgi:hypothetical protein
MYMSMGYPLRDHSAIIDALADTTTVRNALAERSAKEVDQRRNLVAELHQLDHNAKKELPVSRAAVEKAAEALYAIQRAEREAAQKVLAAQAAASAASWQFDYRRQQIVSRLTDGASPEIDAFIRWCDDEMNEARKRFEYATHAVANQVTGTRRTVTTNNGKSVSARVAALASAVKAAEALKLDPDQEVVPTKLKELRESVPQVEPLAFNRSN